MAMKTIFVFNDHSDAAKHAATLALSIAVKTNADVCIANLLKVFQPATKKMELAACALIGDGGSEPDLVTYLNSINKNIGDFKPEINHINVYNHSASQLAEFVIKNNIWMMVKGLDDYGAINMEPPGVEVQHVLNRVSCPLLLVPSKLQIKDFERIVYMADLRYCRVQVVKYLAELSWPYRARLIIDHLSAKGLPDMEQNYSYQVFQDMISKNIKYDQLFFNNIRERNIQKAADIMIHGMQVDLLALVNHRFHFKEILGDYIPRMLPENISIPLLIFPY